MALFDQRLTLDIGLLKFGIGSFDIWHWLWNSEIDISILKMLTFEIRDFDILACEPGPPTPPTPLWKPYDISGQGNAVQMIRHPNEMFLHKLLQNISVLSHI